MIENEITEFKREYVDDIKKSVIAFANTNGGSIFIGIDNDGTPVGVEDTDDCQLKLSSSLYDSIRPDVTMFTDIKVVVMDGKNIVKISVQRGTARPYYLAGKCVRPEGIYIRQGSANVPASEERILNLIRETSGDNYETERSLTQELTFNTADKYFAERSLPFGTEQKKTLHLISEDGTYYNLALLLSDQCEHTIKFAVFEGSVKTNFKDRREFSGSLFKQLEETYSYIGQFNHIHSEFEGLRRIDIYDYPIEAIREALLNSIVHREYSYSASTLIRIFDDRMEFVTIGGLPNGISAND
ncbi:MAG: putative DNA binding domain-containing protein, partial [Ruminococcus sp.]|nr:putative DNA binding domain-containing protein [Ruminococcus sp.]